MGQQESYLKQLLFFAAIILLPLSFVGVVYWRYLQVHEDYLIHRNFRILGAIGKSMRERIEYLDKAVGYGDPLKKLEKSLQDFWSSLEREALKNQLNSEPQPEKRLKVLQADPAFREFKDTFLKETVKFIPDLQSSLDVRLASDIPPADQCPEDKRLYEIKHEWQLCFSRVVRLKDDSVLSSFEFEVTAFVPLKKILEPFVRRPEFEDILVFYRKNTQSTPESILFQWETPNLMSREPTTLDEAVLFQRGALDPLTSEPTTSNVVVTRIVDLLEPQKPAATTEKPSSSATGETPKLEKSFSERAKEAFEQVTQARLSKVQLAGTDYKVFMQPWSLHLQSSEAEATPKNNSLSQPNEFQFVLCGLVRATQFAWEYRAIPYEFVVIFPGIVLLIALSWPFLHVWTLGPKDRLSVIDVFSLIGAAFVGSALVTLFLLDAYAYFTLHNTLDSTLKNIAINIGARFTNEIKTSYKDLKIVAESLTLPDPKGRNGKCVREIVERSIPQSDPEHGYPFFDFVS